MHIHFHGVNALGHLIGSGDNDAHIACEVDGVGVAVGESGIGSESGAVLHIHLNVRAA